MNIFARRFEATDFDEYRRWFDDAALHAALGPLDEEWLDHVLHEDDGAQYAIECDGNLVAVIGVHFATLARPCHYLTDISVRPDLRGHGVAHAALRVVMSREELGAFKHWRAAVSPANHMAIRFFQRLGWTPVDDRQSDDELHEFDFVTA
ncbi:MAG: GNAT family N-acetyltransferase [Planctomycetes bacterium]|jgi:RimJ/RimL family protein N-acetyltransferase|nr:GNAT family N-acetyltransferase [Planctomycetota bacterium]